MQHLKIKMILRVCILKSKMDNPLQLQKDLNGQLKITNRSANEIVPVEHQKS